MSDMSVSADQVMVPDRFSLVTFTPLLVPALLKVGFNEMSDAYLQLLELIDAKAPSLQLSLNKLQQQEYESLAYDVRSAILFSWQANKSGRSVRIHVFAGPIAVAEVLLQDVRLQRDESLEKKVQILTRQLLDGVMTDFLAAMATLRSKVEHPYIEQSPRTGEENVRYYWTSRALLVENDQLRDSDWQHFIEQWLKETQRPLDAKDIIEGKKDYSMTWLNYVLVSDDAHLLRLRLDAMVLAQYYYTAQEYCNNLLKEAIANAYVGKNLLQAQGALERSRVIARLHLVSYKDNLKYLNRHKRRALDKILTNWEFKQLVDNSRLMVEICSGRLQEAQHRRRERSSLMTDLLLVTLSFFAVFELSIYLTQYSREFMARPTLEYQDSGPSVFLRFIAGIDTDLMFLLGLVLTCVLVVVYRYIKTR